MADEKAAPKAAQKKVYIVTKNIKRGRDIIKPAAPGENPVTVDLSDLRDWQINVLIKRGAIKKG